MQRYRELHREYPLREFYFVHTGREELEIYERRWLGVRILRGGSGIHADCGLYSGRDMPHHEFTGRLLKEWVIENKRELQESLM